MRFSVRPLLLGVASCVVTSLATGVAAAQTVCSASDISSLDAGCPLVGAICRINLPLTVGDGCTLDFGSRDVVLTSTGRLTIGPGSMTLRAANFTIESGGSVDGRGNATLNRGGMTRFELDGAFTVQGPNGTIDVSGDDGGGSIIVESGGSVNVAGRLRADGNISTGDGGNIIIRSNGDVISTFSSQILATGARQFGFGGLIDFTARGRLDLGATVVADGSDGGQVFLFSGEEMVTRTIEVGGARDAGSGGCVEMIAGTSLQVFESLNLNGVGSGQGSGGGCGGFVCLETRFGDLTVWDEINAEGAEPDGGGGCVTLIAAAGSIRMQPDTTISVRGDGRQGCGGGICMESDGPIQLGSFLDASGGFIAGDIDLLSKSDIAITAPIDATGRGFGACGGIVLIEAGFDGVGAAALNSTLDVGSVGCASQFGCGSGGLLSVSGCRVSVNPAGSLAARAGVGGEIQLTARERLVVQGSVNATTVATSPDAADGTVDFTAPVGATPSISGSVLPPPAVQTLPICTAQRGVNCLPPCPLCGNATVEFPETCDDGGGAAPQSCDGCSHTCELEDCDDGRNCTIDSCSPQLGCRHAPVKLPATPCYEPSEATPTATRTGTGTATASATRTSTTTAVASATRTATATAVASATPTTAVATATATTGPSQSPTREPEPTATPGCIGDCSGDGRVTVNELVRGVNILLDAQPLDTCPGFDRNQSGTVTVDELVAAVRVVLEDTCS